PWRFIVLRGEAKATLADRLEAVAAARPDAPKLVAKLGKLKAPPIGVAVVSRTVDGEIPAWEQLLSAGAVCTTLLYAATAMGYGANWITDWYAYDPEARAVLGLSPDEQVAGFVFIGTAAEPPQERVRPDVTTLTTIWKP
ncbi:MAG TPA: nitroreductase family protein, partial [Caulobacter sp.]|nr:nitroreductase family protein [Caulobacter sp.]